MRTTWTLPLRFFVRECILTRKRKIAVIAWPRGNVETDNELRVSGGREFQSLGAMAEKALLPTRKKKKA